MSLINDMLHDLEKRRHQEARQMPVTDSVMMGQTGMTGRKILFAAAAVVLLAGVVWAGVALLPTMPADRTAARMPAAQQPASSTPVEQQRKVTISPMTVKGEKDSTWTTRLKIADFSRPTAALSVHGRAVLPKMTLQKKEGAARLLLSFTRPPQYGLVQSGRGRGPLIVSFNTTTMGEHLEIPEVANSVLERIRLQPSQDHLRLLVDLAGGTRLESFAPLQNHEAKNSGTEYSLALDFIQEIQSPNSIEEQWPSPVLLEKSIDTLQESTITANQQEKTEIALAKRKRLPSRDKQSYQTGLEQLRQGALEAAARSFSQALAINPAHPMARLRLIATLQQLKQPEQAAVQMRQGLEVLPKNRLLRKEYARYLLHNKQYGTAIALLRQSPVPSVAGDTEYHGLLAALLQESGQYDEAAGMYARLLQIRPENPIWWLGLAVSMDQSGNFEQARNAYQRALNLPKLDRTTREYIKSRLEVLQ